jgi:hypothetical protein
MNKFLVSLVLSTPIFMLSGCAVQTTTYDSGYSNDYVYSVGYYGNRPYWGNNYYYAGYDMGPYGYWGSSYNYYGY